jgi:hypothetical protein
MSSEELLLQATERAITYTHASLKDLLDTYGETFDEEDHAAIEREITRCEELLEDIYLHRKCGTEKRVRFAHTLTPETATEIE